MNLKRATFIASRINFPSRSVMLLSVFPRFSGNANNSVNFLPGNFQLGVSVKVWQINEDYALTEF